MPTTFSTILDSHTCACDSQTAIRDSEKACYESKTTIFDAKTAFRESKLSLRESKTASPQVHLNLKPPQNLPKRVETATRAGPRSGTGRRSPLARIKTRPDELRDQLNTAAAAATAAGLAWPATAPTPAAITAAADAIATDLTDIAAAEGALATLRQTRDTDVATGTSVMQDVDEATDFLYGPDGAEKVNFGLPPKGSGSLPPLVKLTDIKVSDGIPAKSIFFDWEAIQGAQYEVGWFTDAALTQQVGTAVSTQSEYTISGLTTGTQYWMRVRPSRGGQFGPWSDPATRVAPA